VCGLWDCLGKGESTDVIKVGMGEAKMRGQMCYAREWNFWEFGEIKKECVYSLEKFINFALLMNKQYFNLISIQVNG
jgi:hypothetical protein